MAKKRAEPLSASIVAKHFAVNRRTITEWFDRGCPRTSFKEIAQWRAANLRSGRQPLDHRNGNGKADNQPLPLTLQELRLKSETQKIDSDVELRLLRIAEKKKDLISKTDAQRELSELLVRIKERLLAAPDEFQNRFPEPVRSQCKGDFQEFMRQLLLEISRWQLGGEDADDIIIAAARRIEAERGRIAPVPACRPAHQ